MTYYLNRKSNKRYIRETDLESRIFLSTKLSRRQPNMIDDMRKNKNDFVFDIRSERDKSCTNRKYGKDSSKYKYCACEFCSYTMERKENNNNNNNNKSETKQDAPDHRRKRTKYRYWQSNIYNFLERPHGWKQALYHIVIFATVFICLILSVLATIQEFEKIASSVLMQTEMTIIVWLTIELSLRIWSAGCRSRYQGWKGRFKFMFNIFCILDLIIISASIALTMVAFSQNKNKNFATAAFRGLRFFQILRMLRVDRRGGTWKLLGTTVWQHRQELITTLYIGFVCLIISSFIMYLLEKDVQESKIKTYADSLWWGVITLCTIGYGDLIPITWSGKLLASVCALCGISFFALPAGILGSGFALKVQSMQRQKHLNRRLFPAACLIQSLWRCYAAEKTSKCVATWKVHMKPVPDSEFPFSIKQNNSFFNRMASFKKRTPPINGSTANGSTTSEPKSILRDSLRKKPCEQVSLESTPKLTNKSPTDTLAEPHYFFTHSLTENGLLNGKASASDLAPSMENIQEQAKHLTSQSTQNIDEYKTVPEKVKLLEQSKVFKKKFFKRKEQSENYIELDEIQKNAIRALRKIRYFVSRRKFREALRPYDVTDVIEQYSAGHLDMLSRIKSLQFRLDKILGSSKAKDNYDSSCISLASRIVKVERQIDEIDIKFEKFVYDYSLDTKLLMEKMNALIDDKIATSPNKCKFDLFSDEDIKYEERFRRNTKKSEDLEREARKLVQQKIRKQAYKRSYSSEPTLDPHL